MADEQAVTAKEEESLSFIQDHSQLLDLPIELVAKVLSFVDPTTLQSACLLVCKRFHAIVRSQSLWGMKLENRHGPSGYNCLLAMQRLVAAKACGRLIKFQELYLADMFERNLVRNPYGQLNIVNVSTYWSVAKNGHLVRIEGSGNDLDVPGDGIRMTRTELEAAERPRWLELPTGFCYATSYAICEKQQEIDLSENGYPLMVLDIVRPPIAIGEWMAARSDCGSVYCLEVYLLNNNNDVISTFHKEIRIDPGSGGSWIPVTHVFRRYPAGVRKILFRHSGYATSGLKDGHFGAKFANATVKFIFEI